MIDQQTKAVSVSNLEKSYGDVTAVDGVSFDIDRGEVVGVLGPNGAGKTTLIKMMLGLGEPSDGSVTIAGIDISEDRPAAYRHVGAMLEGARNVYWRLTVRQNLAFFARLVGRDPHEQRTNHEHLLERFELTDKADTPVKELSRGQKQKVSLACALARDVDIVFFDEPTLGLDISSSLTLREELTRLVEEESLTVVVTSHDMAVIEDICERLIVLQGGTIIADDAVERLLKELRTQRFEIEYRGQLPSWGDIDGHVDVVETNNGLRLTGTLSSPRELSGILNHLDAANGDIVSIETSEPDLEDAFLALTADGRETSEPRRSVAPIAGGSGR